MNTYHEILAATNSLSPEERAQLLDALWQSVEKEGGLPPSEEWQTEASRRSNLVDAGKMPVSEWSEARRRAALEAGLDG